MPGNSGMNIAAQIKKDLPEALIIFITSHLKYAVESFELSIFRYIPKDSEGKTSLCFIRCRGFNSY